MQTDVPQNFDFLSFPTETAFFFKKSLANAQKLW